MTYQRPVHESSGSQTWRLIVEKTRQNKTCGISGAAAHASRLIPLRHAPLSITKPISTFGRQAILACQSLCPCPCGLRIGPPTPIYIIQPSRALCGASTSYRPKNMYLLSASPRIRRPPIKHEPPSPRPINCLLQQENGALRQPHDMWMTTIFC